MSYLEFICPVICGFFCIIHFIIGLISSKKNNKKIDYICKNCLTPVSRGEEHECDPEIVKNITFLRDSFDNALKSYLETSTVPKDIISLYKSVFEKDENN